MHEQDALAAQLVAELPDRLDEGQSLDIAHGAADLAQHEILVGQVRGDEILDGVGDVGDHLDRRAEIFAPALLGDHVGIDPSGGHVVALPRGNPGEALVMAEIEVGLGAVVGHVDLAMLVRAHGAGVDIDVGVELAQTDLVAARLQQRAERRRCNAFSEGGNHAAGDEDKPRHGPTL